MAAVLVNGASKICTCVHFASYVYTTTVMNGIPIIIAIHSKIQDTGPCKGTLWMLINAFPCCAANIAAAWYLSISLQSRAVIGNRDSVLGRTYHLLCYDPWMALYFLIVVFYFCWMWPGSAWFATDALMDGGGCADGVRKWMSLVIMCNYIYTSIGVSMFFSSLIMAFCFDKISGPSAAKRHEAERQAYSRGESGGAATTSAAAAEPPQLPEIQAQVYGAKNGRDSRSQPLTQYQQQQQQMRGQDMTAMSPAEAHASIMANNTTYQPPYQADPYNNTATAANNRTDFEMGNPSYPSSSSSPPMAQAMIIPPDTKTEQLPMRPTAGKSSNNNVKGNYVQDDDNNDDDDEDFNREVNAVASGTAFGASLAKVFNLDNKATAELEMRGAKASVALSNKFKAARNFMKGK